MVAEEEARAEETGVVSEVEEMAVEVEEEVVLGRMDQTIIVRYLLWN